MLSHGDANGSRGFVGVRGGGSRDSDCVATRSRDGRERGGVFFWRGVWRLDIDVFREWNSRGECNEVEQEEDACDDVDPRSACAGRCTSV